jgi:transcriptional regulator with XRE-family HTH domain
MERTATPPSPLRLERIKQGIQPWRMAQQLGISLSMYYLYEQERRRPAADMRHKIADILKVSVSQIFSEQDNDQN